MIELILDKTTGEKCLVGISQICYIQPYHYKGNKNVKTIIYFSSGYNITVDMPYDEVTELIREGMEESRIEIHNECSCVYEDDDDEPDWNRTEG